MFSDVTNKKTANNEPTRFATTNRVKATRLLKNEPTTRGGVARRMLKVAVSRLHQHWIQSPFRYQTLPHRSKASLANVWEGCVAHRCTASRRNVSQLSRRPFSPKNATTPIVKRRNVGRLLGTPSRAKSQEQAHRGYRRQRPGAIAMRTTLRQRP